MASYVRMLELMRLMFLVWIRLHCFHVTVMNQREKYTEDFPYILAAGISQ